MHCKYNTVECERKTISHERFLAHLFQIHLCVQNGLYRMLCKGGVLPEERGQGLIFT